MCCIESGSQQPSACNSDAYSRCIRLAVCNGCTLFLTFSFYRHLTLPLIAYFGLPLCNRCTLACMSTYVADIPDFECATVAHSAWLCSCLFTSNTGPYRLNVIRIPEYDSGALAPLCNDCTLANITRQRQRQHYRIPHVQPLHSNLYISQAQPGIE